MAQSMKFSTTSKLYTTIFRKNGMPLPVVQEFKLSFALAISEKAPWHLLATEIQITRLQKIYLSQLKYHNTSDS
jgi:hypothetical protein